MNGVVLDGNEETPKKLNQLAREQMKTKLLNDILIDMTICRIEGWSVLEYIEDLKTIIVELVNNSYKLQEEMEIRLDSPTKE